MKLGNFTELASTYVHRPGYSLTALRVLYSYVYGTTPSNFQVADIGAGTGKLTKDLCTLGLPIIAVEPNDAMRSEGIKYCPDKPVRWQTGTAEASGLETASMNWILMASSFHWVNRPLALLEFHRVIKPGGFLTVLWNPRDLGACSLQKRIDSNIGRIAPEIKRVSSGASQFTQNMVNEIQSTGHFKDTFLLESDYKVTMTRERYLGAWRSVNDIQSQAGPEKFAKILAMIESEVDSQDELVVPYKTRAWTAQRHE